MNGVIYVSIFGRYFYVFSSSSYFFFFPNLLWYIYIHDSRLLWFGEIHGFHVPFFNIVEDDIKLSSARWYIVYIFMYIFLKNYKMKYWKRYIIYKKKEKEVWSWRLPNNVFWDKYSLFLWKPKQRAQRIRLFCWPFLIWLFLLIIWLNLLYLLYQSTSCPNYNLSLSLFKKKKNTP